MRKTALLALCVIALAGCVASTEPTEPMPPVEPIVTFEPDDPAYAAFALKRVGLILDEKSYGRPRAVYVLTDRETGVEYLGISGIGLVERRKP